VEDSQGEKILQFVHHKYSFTRSNWLVLEIFCSDSVSEPDPNSLAPKTVRKANSGLGIFPRSSLMELGQVFIGLLELSGQFGKGTICSISYFLPAALALVFFNVIGNKI